jgi:hypothetical protein
LDLERATDAEVARCREGADGRHRFVFSTGAKLQGRLDRCARRDDGRLLRMDLSAVRLELPGRPATEFAHYRLIPLGDFVAAHAGAVDPKFYPATAFSPEQVPRPRRLPSREQELLALYERARAAHEAGRRPMEAEFPRISGLLERDHGEEWLLRWNMLESLLKARSKEPLVSALRAELERLEVHFEHRQPIASGLRYLSERVA